MFYILY